MRTPGLQYLYLQKPFILILLVATLSVLPWIGMGEYYTKGEPREASVAVSMLEEGNWILPRVYADEFAYKPPFTHWIIAAFSLPSGEVTPFTSRLPSAIAFVIMIACCFFFFGRNLKGHKAFIACLLMITSFELHRAAMTSRVDMVLTALIVGGLVSLYYWEENKKTKGIPWYIPVLLGCAALVKGPVGILLPLLIFGIYLLLMKYNFWKVLLKTTIVAILSFVPLFIWYYLAYREAGQDFLNVVWAENFGRLLGSEDVNIKYNLGHEEPFWYNFITLATGFIPWTLLIFFSLFGLKYTIRIPQIKIWKDKLLSMHKIKLFSLVAAVIIVLFYCIPMSKRSVYLMPAYPFIAIFMAQYILYIAEYHSRVNRFFAVFMGCLINIVAICCLLALCGVLNIAELSGHFVSRTKTIYDVKLFSDALSQPSFIYILLLIALFYSLFVLFYQLRKKNNLKIFYTVVGVYFMFGLLQDGVALPTFKNGTSVKPFITEIKKKYPLTKDNMYVMNNLLEYGNLYGPNFYLHNAFKNFEKELPESGYFFSTPGAMEKILPMYGDEYSFSLLDQTPNPYNDVREVVQVYKLKKK